jgi:hypothetical protein
VTIIELHPEHAGALSRFFAELPAADLTFIEEDVTDAARVRSWAAAASGRWLAVDDRIPGHSTAVPARMRGRAPELVFPLLLLALGRSPPDRADGGG